jgi:hypothetical protein
MAACSVAHGKAEGCTTCRSCAADPHPSIHPSIPPCCSRAVPTTMATPALPTRDAVRQAIASFVKLARGAPSAKGNEAELFGSQLPVAFSSVCDEAAVRWPDPHTHTHTHTYSAARARLLRCPGPHAHTHAPHRPTRAAVMPRRALSRMRSLSRVSSVRWWVGRPGMGMLYTPRTFWLTSTYLSRMQAGVVDMMAASPKKRISIPRSTLGMLPAHANQYMLSIFETMGGTCSTWVPGLYLWAMYMERCLGEPHARLPISGSVRPHVVPIGGLDWRKHWSHPPVRRRRRSNPP